MSADPPPTDASPKEVPSSESPLDASKLSFNEEFPAAKGWDAIGFHRVLGKEFWEFTLEIIGTFFWVFLIGYIVPIIQPYPEIAGYEGVAGALFATVYTAFDLGTNFPYPRYISELQVRNPSKMMEYIRYVIAYQMITGLVQITALTGFTFNVIKYSNYAYLMWLLLLILQKQWPGMLGIFYGILEGCQQWGLLAKINAVREWIFLPFRIGMALTGLWYGKNHPELGIIMSMAMFSILSAYIQDVFFLFVTGRVFSRILKSFGYRLRDAWSLEIGKDVMQTAVKYGIQATIIPTIGSAIGTYIFILYLSQIPGIVTWRALIAIGSGFTGLMGAYPFPMSPAIAEAYMNDKKELAEFYCSYYLKFKYFFLIMLGTIIFSIVPIYGQILGNYSGLQYYSTAIVFIIPALINNLIWPLFNLPGDILWGAEKITLQNAFTVLSWCLNLFFVWLWLVVLKVQMYGLPGIIFLLCFENLIPNLILCSVRWYYVKKKILNYKVYWMGTFILPFIIAVPVFLVAKTYCDYIFPWLRSVMLFEIAIGISIFLAVTVLLFVLFFPLTGVIGVWDDYMLFVFDQSVELAGPSRGFFRLASKVMKQGIKLGRRLGLHGRWGIPWQKAHEQVRELMVLREANRAKNIATQQAKNN